MKKLLRYKFRNTRQKPSKWLLSSICTMMNFVNSKHIHCINSKNNLSNLILTNEVLNNVKFLSEGLIKTYSTDKFLKWIKSQILNILPDQLKYIRFSDLNLADKDNTQLIDFIDSSPQINGVSSMIAIIVPWNKNSDFKTKLDTIVDKSYIFGYDLTSVDKFEHDLLPNVDVFIIQFEARFSYDKFKLANVLLHVSPLNLLSKISKNGLVPKSKSTEFKYADRIYLFNQCSKETILDYAVFKMNSTQSSGFCIFKIQKENLINNIKFKNGKLTFYVDTAFKQENNSNIEAIFTYNNIDLDIIDDECLVFKDFSSKPEILNFKKMKNK